MIRTEREYRTTVAQLDAMRRRIADQRSALAAEGLDPDGVARVVAPIVTMAAGMEDELTAYEEAKRGNLAAMPLAALGHALILARIASGLSQRDLAKLVNCDESQVSRDENNDYHGIAPHRAAAIADALGYVPTVRLMRKPVPKPEG